MFVRQLRSQPPPPLLLLLRQKNVTSDTKKEAGTQDRGEGQERGGGTKRPSHPTPTFSSAGGPQLLEEVRIEWHQSISPFRRLLASTKN